ncbi:MAG: protein kinase, partial [Planctomycetota bacterium]
MESEQQPRPELGHGPHFTQEQLQQFLNDQTPALLSEAIESHIDHCTDCQSIMDRLAEGSLAVVDQLRCIEPGMLDAETTTRKGPDPRYTTDDDEVALRPDSPFQLQKLIARGGMGAVYLATDQRLQRQVAIKVIRQEFRDQRENARMKQRFLREATISGQLQHPGIVPIHELGQLKDQSPFIVMKLIRGQTLSELLRNQSDRFEQRQLLEIFRQICNAISYAHSRNVIHRDLKPKNIMIGDFGEVQIMDWGLAKYQSDESQIPNDPFNFREPFTATTDETISGSGEQTNPGELTRAGYVIGTPGYMSPEQAVGHQVDTRSDVFALGAILLQILTGTTPNRLANSSDGNRLNEVQSHLHKSDTDPLLAQLVRECLDPNPDRRPQSAKELNDKISDFLNLADERLRKAEIQKAEAEAKFDAERKRQSQFTWFSIAISIFLLLALVSSLLFLTERNARLSAKLEVESAEIAEARSTENRIQNNYLEASDFFGRATNEPIAQQVSLLNQALIALSRSNSEVDEIENRDLQNRFKDLKRKIEDRVFQANQRELQEQRETRFVIGHQKIYSQSKMPNDSMEMTASAKVEQDYRSLFQELGIGPTVDPTQIKTLYHQSAIQNEVFDGLTVWYRQTRLLEPESEKNLWLGNVIRAVDPDPFRNKVRDLIEQNVTASELPLDDPRALESVRSVILLASHLINLDTFSEQENFLTAAHRYHPDNFEINWQLGTLAQVQVKPKRPEKALRHYLACLALEPDNPGVLLNVSRCHLELDEEEEGIAFAEKFQKVAPDYSDAYHNLATYFFELQDIRTATKYGKKAYDVRPTSQVSALYGLM